LEFLYGFRSKPSYSPTKIVTTIKSILAREIMGKHPEVKEKLWGGEFWSDGYFVSTVRKYGNEEEIKDYVRKQGTEKEYTEIYKKQLELFD
jgi:REP element-mobilizing transposase RayT